MAYRTFQEKKRLAADIEARIGAVLDMNDALVDAKPGDLAVQQATVTSKLAFALKDILELIQLVDLPGDQG